LRVGLYTSHGRARAAPVKIYRYVGHPWLNNLVSCTMNRLNVATEN